MKGYKKILGVLSLLMLVAFFAVGCGQPQTQSVSETEKVSRINEIKNNGKLILATGNYRPFEYHDEKTDQIIGYDIDVANIIAEKIGVPLEIKEMQFTSLIPTLQNGQADLVIAAMYIKPERAEVVDFATPYMETGMVLVTRKGEEAIKSLDDLEGKTVGVKAGAVSEKVVQEMVDKGKKITIKSYKETVDYLLDLETGRIDAAVNDLLNQLEYNKTNPNVQIVGDAFTKSELGIAVRKGDTELLELINTVLAEMKQSGKADELYKKWITAAQ